ncbi:MAG: DUF1631 domain-containing protein [Gammaproteobacteria bacterium]|nr:DUF1631 domain-containing protein [Gammaproteobacteria bacterium]
MAAKIHNIQNHVKDDKYKKIIIKARLCIQKQLTEMMSAVFTDTDEMFFDSAKNTITEDDRSTIFDVMRVIRIERNTIVKSYIQKITNKLTTKKDADTVESCDELSLVSDDDIEELVAINSISNRSDNLHAEALSHLQARIEHLALKTRFIFNKETLLPKQFCEDFIASISHIEFDSNSKLICIKVFSTHIDNTLRTIYDTINQLLIDAGILPQIKLTPKQSTARQTPTQHDNHYNMAPLERQSAEHPANHQHTTDMHQVINSYIRSSMPANPVTKINEKNFYDRQQILESLSNLQLKFAQTNQPVSFDLITNSLTSNINAGTGGLVTKQVNHIDEKTIEVIELLFKEILNDSTLTNTIRTLILKLQIPTIKVAMLDQEFFNDPDHPTRNFLNTLSYVGIGITDDDDSFFCSIEIIIDTLLNDFEQDSASFQHALDSLNILFDKEFEKCQKKESHTQKNILQQHARKIVLQELQLYAQGKIISKQMQPLVLKLWPTRMYQHYINHGKSSDQWNEAINTLRLIINTLQPPCCHKELQFLIDNQDSLIQTIQDELYDSKQDMDTINLAILNLSESYLDLINSADIAEPEDNSFDKFSLDTFSGTISDIQNMLPGLAAANSHLATDESTATAINDKREQLQHLPKEIKPGLWFELYDGDNKPVRRLKLSVIIMEEAQLIFVNRQGVKIMEKSALDFAAELEQQISKIIADHSVFDAALSSVITALSKSA